MLLDEDVFVLLVDEDVLEVELVVLVDVLFVAVFCCAELFMVLLRGLFNVSLMIWFLVVLLIGVVILLRGKVELSKTRFDKV